MYLFHITSRDRIMFFKMSLYVETGNVSFTTFKNISKTPITYMCSINSDKIEYTFTHTPY